jgi:hypothetical protein
MQQDWKIFKEKLSQDILSTKLIVKEISCETDRDVCIKQNIKGLPTLRLVVDNTIVEYTGNRTADDLLLFIRRYIK